MMFYAIFNQATKQYFCRLNSLRHARYAPISAAYMSEINWFPHTIKGYEDVCSLAREIKRDTGHDLVVVLHELSVVSMKELN